MKKIIAAVDGSPASLKAAAFAGDLTSRYGAELLLATVAHEMSAGLAAELEIYLRQEHIDVPVGEWPTEQAETVVADTRLQAEGKGTTKISAQVTRGDPAEEIIGLSQRQGADLIGVGSRGHGRLAGLLLGSVAQKVLSHAHAWCSWCTDGTVKFWMEKKDVGALP